MSEKKPLREEDLRDAKDFLVGAIADQAHALGIEPNVRAHEDFVAPILRKVEIDVEAERQAELAAPAPPAPDPDAPLGPWEVRENLETGEIRMGVEVAAELERQRAAETEDVIAHRLYLRLLASKPDWKKRILAIALSRDLSQPQKKAKLHDLFTASFRYFGHPRALLQAAKTFVDMGRR